MQVLSAVPGRVRIREDNILKDNKLCQMIELYLNDIVGIKHARVNPVIGTIVVAYDIEKVDIHMLERKIEQILQANTLYLEYIHEQYEEYLKEEKKLKHGIRKMTFFGGLYILFKIKQFFFGKYFLSRSLPVLQMASAITIIKGYPRINKVYKKIGSKLLKNPDRFIYLLGMSFTFMREGNKGTMLLFLKSFIDTLQAYADLQNKNLLVENHPNPIELIWYNHGQQEYLMPQKAIEMGDIISFYKNETISLEGTIIEGEALVNHMLYSGQPEMRNLKKDDKVYEGMTIISGEIKMKVSRIPEKRPKPDMKLKELSINKRVTKYREKAIYSGSILALASYFITGSTLSPLAVLLVMTPSASKAALSGGFTNYLKLLQKHKIILRNINGVENIINGKTFVFDKTGTLTKGRLRIAHVEILDKSHSEEEILEICSAAESNIAHPVAHTFSEAGQRNATTVENIIYIPSKGVLSNYKGLEVIIGNKNLMLEYNISINDDMDNENYYLPVYVAIDKKLVAQINMIEEIEPYAAEVIDELRLKSVEKISIISGDLQENVKYMAEKLHIEDYYGELSIEEKAQFIEEQKRYGPVIMVGDGVNDADAMKTADISISFGDQAAQQAILQSDCILAQKELGLILQLRELTEKSYGQIENNIRYTKHYNFIFGILSMLGYISPFKAKSINTLNSIIAMFNSTRISKIKDHRQLY